MSETPKLYIAGMGMITPVGANTDMTVAAVRAGISAYKISDYMDMDDEPITMASVPDSIFMQIDADIDEGSRYNERHDRVTKMSIIAIREACADTVLQESIPLVLAMPEEQGDTSGLSSLIGNLEKNCSPWVNSKQYRTIHSGRAAGIEAIAFAFRYLYELQNDFILIGGSDSHRDYACIAPMSKDNRMLVQNGADGFAPGEAASFILLTRKPENAMIKNNHMVSVSPPGIANEPGHFGSDLPYRGEGLDQAFKQAINGRHNINIECIYSSMNGENHWAKEYGVAFMRNKAAFSENTEIEHPADIFGDVGAATGPVLTALSAEKLFNSPASKTHLVYSSSDSARRGAIILDKLPANRVN